MTLEQHFEIFRKQIIGIDQEIELSDGSKSAIIYADWIASGRLYAPIEDHMRKSVAPFVANTHTESTLTGTAMTRAYHDARDAIKKHVNAGSSDSLFLAGFGMTAAVNKLQRLLGLRVPDSLKGETEKGNRPMVLITHMEHHSNQITWSECDVDIRIVPPVEETGLPDLEQLEQMVEKYRGCPLLIGAFTACSNVTGIITPFGEMAKIVHRGGGYCFVDFAASAPYVDIDMHPADPDERLDAVMFSPHKFLGGPGTSGVLVMNNILYKQGTPDLPGGGTVKWTTPFGTHRYVDDIEAREDGGTPGFLQAIRIALAIKLKEVMGIRQMNEREEEIKALFIEEICQEPGIILLENKNSPRIAVFSFYVESIHHNLIVRLLNDHYGIQTRGGCSCAGTYGHILFHITKKLSEQITALIDNGDLSEKPGWVRVSLHPTMTNDEIRYIGSAIVETVRYAAKWDKEYSFDLHSGDYVHFSGRKQEIPDLISTFRAT
ncbi:MAG: aminotransferase class V-fold PLP-dependent enzyme [Spirochaetales bacterium]|jgi:selenocysteine lyase/cysteine desulfurase|nr:aminotransferase class V-fold PLP-dependent enzyme [Spirochaetales bacterium]